MNCALACLCLAAAYVEAARLEGGAAFHSPRPSADTRDLVCPAAALTGHVSELNMGCAECFFAVPKTHHPVTLNRDHGKVRPSAVWTNQNGVPGHLDFARAAEIAFAPYFQQAITCGYGHLKIR